MIGFEIIKNGKKIATAGIDKPGTLAVSTVRGKHSLSNFPEDYQDEIKKISDAEEFEKENFVLSVEGQLEGRNKDNNLTGIGGKSTPVTKLLFGSLKRIQWMNLVWSPPKSSNLPVLIIT